MPMVHVRVVCPDRLATATHDALARQHGAIAVRHTAVGDSAPDDAIVEADLPREQVNAALADLDAHGLRDCSFIALEPIDTALGQRTIDAEEAAPGEGDDAVVWDELVARTGGEARLTGVYLAFMVLATLLAAIGVVTNSPITLVGGMVLGPEFGALAGVSVGLVRKQPLLVRRATLALVLGFVVSIAVTVLAALAARGTGLITAADLVGQDAVEYIYHPGWFSLITAVLAGIAGMLTLTSARTAGLVGVFISVTTIPASGYAAVAFAVGQWYQLGQSLLQLGINLVGMVVAGYLTLLVRHVS